MFIYLAHPIDFAGDQEQIIGVAVEETVEALKDAGATAIYRPASAWTVAGDMHAKIQEINIAALTRADAMMVIYPQSVPTIGVPFEMGIAHTCEIPMVMVRGRTTAEARQMRSRSAILTYLGAPMYGYDDLSSAACRVVTLAMYRRQQENARETTGDPKEGTPT